MLKAKGFRHKNHHDGNVGVKRVKFLHKLFPLGISGNVTTDLFVEQWMFYLMNSLS